MTPKLHQPVAIKPLIKQSLRETLLSIKPTFTFPNRLSADPPVVRSDSKIMPVGLYQYILPKKISKKIMELKMLLDQRKA